MPPICLHCLGKGEQAAEEITIELAGKFHHICFGCLQPTDFEEKVCITRREPAPIKNGPDLFREDLAPFVLADYIQHVKAYYVLGQ